MEYLPMLVLVIASGCSKVDPRDQAPNDETVASPPAQRPGSDQRDAATQAIALIEPTAQEKAIAEKGIVAWEEMTAAAAKVDPSDCRAAARAMQQVVDRHRDTLSATIVTRSSPGKMAWLSRAYMPRIIKAHKPIAPLIKLCVNDAEFMRVFESAARPLP